MKYTYAASISFGCSLQQRGLAGGLPVALNAVSMLLVISLSISYLVTDQIVCIKGRRNGRDLLSSGRKQCPVCDLSNTTPCGTLLVCLKELDCVQALVWC